MTHRFSDSSALLRLLLGEPGETIRLDDGPIHASILADIECHRAMYRAHALGRLSDRELAIKLGELERLLSALTVYMLTPEVVALARAPHAIATVRSLDAIHVATACLVARHLPAPVEFWTHDERQATAALSLGLTLRGVSV